MVYQTNPYHFFPKKRIIDKAPPKKTIESKQYVFICFFGGYPATMAGKNKGVTGEQITSWIFTPFGSRGL